ncbi:MAG: pectinesterase family protein, partial [Candidatus Ornithospirochaeta sp.]
MLAISVRKDGSGDYQTIQEALDAIPYETEAEITVGEGIYREKIFSDKRSLSIRGEGNVIIAWSDGAYEKLSDGFKRGTFRTYTAFFSGERLCLKGITIINSAGSGKNVGQGIALYLDVTDAIVEDVVLKGHQDTLFLAPLPEEERENRGF